MHHVRELLCRLENTLFLMITAPLIAFLPAPLAYSVACLRGRWRYHLHVRARNLIMCNLQEVLGAQLSPADRAQVARDVFRRRSCQAVDEMRLAGTGRALMRLVQIQGLEHLEAALAGGKGAILCTGHFGQFAGAYSLLGAAGFPITAVGNWESTVDPSMSRLHRIALWLVHQYPLAKHRHRPEIEPRKAGVLAAAQMAEVLRANEVIAIPIDAPVMDPNDLGRAVPVDFLGHRARLLPGTAAIACRTGAQVLVAVMCRSADWRHQVLEISAPGAVEGDPLVAFKRCVAEVEAPITRNLAHWDFWEERQVLINLGLVPGVAVKSPAYWDFHPTRRPWVSG
jgi:KDO2-lipid IV(A) lauroyltransferase